ncbi:MAG: glycosyltransferase, partial [Nitrosopumilaceae archaeon]
WYIQPSLIEGCPMSVLEAMSLNVPVALSYVGDMKEIIDSGCAIPTPTDVKGITKTLASMGSNSTPCPDSLQYFKQNYSIHTMYSKYQELYEDTLTK